jgi:hypothetical protein
MLIVSACWPGRIKFKILFKNIVIHLKKAFILALLLITYKAPRLIMTKNVTSELAIKIKNSFALPLIAKNSKPIIKIIRNDE